jgi:uncharacterized protein
MPLTLDENRATYQIKGFKPGFIQVNENMFTHSIIISPNQLITDWEPQSIAELTPEHLKKILPLKPAILLIGTGEHLSFPAVDIYGELLNQGIGVEIMDTSAACRTFNALTAEDRNVVAVLIIK